MSKWEAGSDQVNNQSRMFVKIGFSGSRFGLSDMQKNILRHVVGDKCGEFHHGLCVGGDADAHDIVREFKDFWKIIGHPPANSSLRANRICDELRPEKPYLMRNKDIVDETAFLIGMPKQQSPETGGTWYTINYCRKQLVLHPEKAGMIILRDGTIGNIIVDRSKLGSQLHGNA